MFYSVQIQYIIFVLLQLIARHLLTHVEAIYTHAFMTLKFYMSFSLLKCLLLVFFSLLINFHQYLKHQFKYTLPLVNLHYLKIEANLLN